LGTNRNVGDLCFNFKGFGGWLLVSLPEASVYIHDRDGRTVKTHIHFGVQVSAENDRWRAGTGTTGRIWLSHDLAEDGTFYQAFALGGYNVNNVALTATARLPFGHRHSHRLVDRSLALAVQLPF
jgi:glucose/arabinose dehydrogenase